MFTIVYVLKNTDVTIEQYIESYKGSQEIGSIRKMVKKKYGQIERIQREMMAKKVNGHNNLSVINNGDEAELLQFQLSNNSIVSVGIDDDELYDAAIKRGHQHGKY